MDLELDNNRLTWKNTSQGEISMSYDQIMAASWNSTAIGGCCLSRNTQSALVQLLSTLPSVESAFLPICFPTGTSVFLSKAPPPEKLSWYYTKETTLHPGPSRGCNLRRKWLSLVLETHHTGDRQLRVSESHVPCCTPLSTSFNQERTLWQNWGISTPKPNGTQHPGHSEEMLKSSNQAISKHTLTKN